MTSPAIDHPAALGATTAIAPPAVAPAHARLAPADARPAPPAVQRCDTVFLLSAQLRGAVSVADEASLRRGCVDAVANAATLLAAQLPRDDVEDATFALVALLDESVATSEWPGRQAWIADPLQRHFFGTADAGEAFFRRLEAILDARVPRPEVVEVYARCLAFGFRGEYRLRPAAELAALHARIAAALAALPHRAPVEPVTLSPDGLPPDDVGQLAREIPLWVIVVVAVAAAVVGYAVLAGLATWRAADAARLLARSL